MGLEIHLYNSIYQFPLLITAGSSTLYLQYFDHKRNLAMIRVPENKSHSRLIAGCGSFGVVIWKAINSGEESNLEEAGYKEML